MLPVAVLLVALVLPGCSRVEEEPEPQVTIGVGSTTEQQVLAALTVAALERAGVDTALRANLGQTVILRRQALAGAVDLYWDYTGAAWALGLGQQNPPAEPAESYERVREEDRRRGLVWLEPTTANATLAMFVRSEDLPVDEAGGMDWLAGVLSGGEHALCVDEDFQTRPGGLRELASDYYLMDLARVDVVAASESEAIDAVAAGECFAGLATATAGRAHGAGLVPVVDTLGVFPAFVVAPVVREDTLAAVPEVAEALRELATAIDTTTLGRLNAAAESGEDPQALATRFLADLEAPAPTP